MAKPSGESQRVETKDFNQIEKSQSVNSIVEGGNRSSFKTALNGVKSQLEGIWKNRKGGDNVTVAAFERELELELPGGDRIKPVENLDMENLIEYEQKRNGFSTLKELGKAIREVAESGSDKDNFVTYEIIGIDDTGVKIRLNYKYHAADTTYVGTLTNELEGNIRKQLSEKVNKTSKLAELKSQVVVHSEATPRNPNFVTINQPKVLEESLESSFGKLPESVVTKNKNNVLNRTSPYQSADQKKQNEINENNLDKAHQQLIISDPKNYPNRNKLNASERNVFDLALLCIKQGISLSSEVQREVVSKAKGEEYTPSKPTLSILDIFDLRN